MQLDWMWALSAILAKTRSIRMSCCKGNKANHHVTFKENNWSSLENSHHTSYESLQYLPKIPKSERSIKSHGMVATKPALVMQSPSKIVPFVAGYTFISMVGEHITPRGWWTCTPKPSQSGWLLELKLGEFSIFSCFQFGILFKLLIFPQNL